MVAAGYLPDDVVPDIADERRVLDQQVRQQVVPLPPHVLDMPLRIGGVVFRPHHLRRVPGGDVLALETGNGRRREDLRLFPADCHQPVRVALQLQFSRPVNHVPRPGDGDIAANQIPLRRVRHVL